MDQTHVALGGGFVALLILLLKLGLLKLPVKLPPLKLPEVPLEAKPWPGGRIEADLRYMIDKLHRIEDADRHVRLDNIVHSVRAQRADDLPF